MLTDSNIISRFFLLLTLLVSPVMSASVRAAALQEQTVLDQGTLKITEVKFDNFLGVVASNLEVKAGDEAGMKFRIENYSKLEGKDDTGRPEYRVQLDYTIDIQDPSGVPLQPTVTGQVQTLLGTQDDGWRPTVEWSVRIPETAPTGRYPVLIRLTDRIGNQTIEHTSALRVRGQAVKTSGNFEIVQLEFAPDDDGPWRPLWYYELKAPIYVRYKIAGYAVSPEKQITVEQDWVVLDAEGKEILRQPAATQEDSRGFYPPRFIQSYFSITLRDPYPGEYKIHIDARDAVGNQSASAEARFVLRP